MDTKELLNEIKKHLKEEHTQLLSIANNSKQGTTGSEVKQEGKYDTRAIEAGYLAGAQAKRVKEVEMELLKLERFKFPLEVSSKIMLGSLFKVLEESEEVETFYFISPAQTSLREIKGIQVISLQSPIASAAISLKEGDVFEVETPRSLKEFEIIEIL